MKELGLKETKASKLPDDVPLLHKLMDMMILTVFNTQKNWMHIWLQIINLEIILMDFNLNYKVK